MREAECVPITGGSVCTPASPPATRRAVLAGLGLSAALAVGTTAAPAVQDDGELLAALAAFDAIERQVGALWTAGPAYIGDDDARLAAETPLHARQAPLLDRICALTARTPEGWQARARALLLFDAELADNVAAGDDPDEHRHERMIIALVRDLAAGAA